MSAPRSATHAREWDDSMCGAIDELVAFVREHRRAPHSNRMMRNGATAGEVAIYVLLAESREVQSPCQSLSELLSSSAPNERV